MRYERGKILGLFCGELGIRSSDRVVITRCKNGLHIWNLNTATEFALNIQGNALSACPRPVPEHCASIFVESDQLLLDRIADRTLSPWSEERETILSELRYRNLTPYERPHHSMPLLLSYLVHQFRPGRSLRRTLSFTSI